MLAATIEKNDKKARQLIWLFSVVVFSAIALLSNFKLNVDLGFDIHLFAKANAFINIIIAILLLTALIAVKNKNYKLHKKLMISALVLSILFLASYIAHHLLAGETRFGDVDHNGIVNENEKSAVGNYRVLYYVLLITHIPLAAIILPFILFTAYRALVGDYEQHKKLTRITWPIWFYVAVSGVIVYIMISPYYS